MRFSSPHEHKVTDWWVKNNPPQKTDFNLKKDLLHPRQNCFRKDIECAMIGFDGGSNVVHDSPPKLVFGVFFVIIEPFINRFSMKKLLLTAMLGMLVFGAGCGREEYKGLSGLDLQNDKAFMQHMKPHHEEAIEAAQIIVEKSQNAELKALAQSIIDAQTAEIAQMDAWSQAWYGEPLVSADYMPMMRDLSELSGRELDTSFMKDMREHHGMAIDMAKDIQDIAEHQEIKDMAANIIATQSAEIDQMDAWLAL